MAARKQHTAGFKQEQVAPPSERMLQDLASGHQQIARTARGLLPLAAGANAESTADLLAQLMQVHEKTAWMLRSMLSG